MITEQKGAEIFLEDGPIPMRESLGPNAPVPKKAVHLRLHTVRSTSGEIAGSGKNVQFRADMLTPVSG